MKKRILSLLCVLALCLGLLPATALAAEGALNTLYVGNRILPLGKDSYWTTNQDSGALTECTGSGDNWNVKYESSSNTLTLREASIQGGSNAVSAPYDSGIYALSHSGQPVSLTIKLIGENTITGFYGIFLDAEESETSYGTGASLTITSENNGSLQVSGLYNGIYVKSGTGDASLNINDASVVAKTTQTYSGYAGVYVQSSMYATNSPQLSLKVDGGSLTASGTGSSDGIWFYVGSSQATGATTSLTVSENAIVDARNGGISASRISETLPTPTPTGDNRSGIVFDGSTGTVYGDVTLDESLTINQGETLTIPEGSSLNANGKLTNDGTINVEKGGNLTGDPGGTVISAPTIGTQPASQSVTVGQTASFTVEATGEKLSYQWQQSTDNSQSWTDISGANAATYTTAATTTSMNGYQYRCVVSNSAGSITSDAVSLTVNEHVHTWGNLVWSWSEDGKTCTVTFTCEKDENHKESPKVDVTSAVKKPATCTETGVTTYTATVEFNGQTYTDTKDVADLPATGHSYGEPVWNWSEAGKTCTVTFTCEKDENHKESPKVDVTSAVKKPATCTETGVTTYTATVEFNGQTYTDTKDVADIPATGHSYGEPVWNWSEDGKTCTVTFTCEKDETHKQTPEVKVTSAVKTPATCTETGVTTYTATVEFNGQTYTNTKDVADIPATGHSYDDGKCTVCGAIASDFKVIITAGANGTWQKGTKDGLSFTSNAAFAHFLKVQVDGKDLDASNYTVKEGSTIVTLKTSYLETLSVGKHTLAIVSETGTATTEFTIKAAAVTDDTQSPQTGDDSNIALWIAVLLAAGTALTGTAVYSRKRKYSK